MNDFQLTSLGIWDRGVVFQGATAKQSIVPSSRLALSRPSQRARKSADYKTIIEPKQGRGGQTTAHGAFQSGPPKVPTEWSFDLHDCIHVNPIYNDSNTRFGFALGLICQLYPCNPLMENSLYTDSTKHKRYEADKM